jgi:glycosyltransferase involved in cell wall biosynthesis
LAGITSIDRQEDYINISGPNQVNAVQAALARKPDLVFAHRLHTFTPLWPLLPALKVPVLFDMDDIEHRALARTIIAQPLWPSERLRLMHVPAVMWRERQAIRLSAASFVCSQDDATALRKLASADTVHVIPNTVNASDHAHHNTTAVVTLGFIGSFAHTPNVDAVQWLLTDIWPQIRRAKPSARLRIGGAGSLQMFGFAQGKDGVEILDFVNDLGAYYQSLSLVIAPLRFGAGTRVKIIEAAGYAMPIVSTTLGAEGLAFNNGTEILLADNSDQFAAQCVKLLENQDLAIEIGIAARRSFEQHYNRNAVVASIKEHIRCALAEASRL